MGRPSRRSASSTRLKLPCGCSALSAESDQSRGRVSDRLPPQSAIMGASTAVRPWQNSCGKSLNLANDFQDRRAQSPSLVQVLGPVEVAFPWPDVWAVLDQVGFAYQAFAKNYSHRLEKMALGLPRVIGNPVRGTFKPTPPVTAKSRHPSPVMIHLDRRVRDWVVRIVAFPAARLPDLSTSRAFLDEFLKVVGDDLKRRAQLPSPSPPRAGTAPGRVPAGTQAHDAPSRRSLPNPGDHVDAELLHEKTKKGGWRARHAASGISGPIQNSQDVPGDKKAGETLTLIVASASEREIAFRCPTAADERHPRKPKDKPRGRR